MTDVYIAEETDCPGEPGFECSDLLKAKGLCRRCYARQQARRQRRENPERIARNKRRNYERHRDEKLEKQRRYREANSEKVAAAIQRWRENNPRGNADAARRWRIANRERAAVNDLRSSRRRRVRQREASQVPFTDAEWEARKSMFGGLCWMCRVEAGTERDHLIPLARGGPDCLSNLRPACRACNASKGTKTPFEMEGLIR